MTPGQSHEVSKGVCLAYILVSDHRVGELNHFKIKKRNAAYLLDSISFF
jgi:hypothetical protein